MPTSKFIPLKLKFSLHFHRLCYNYFLPGCTQIKSLGMMKFTEKIKFGNFPRIFRIFGPTGVEVTEGIDLSDKTCLITGGTNGIGAEMARILMKRNCRIIMPYRNTYKANQFNKYLSYSEQLSIYKLDLCSLASVKRASEEILKKEKKLDIVILNAGVFGIPWILTEDGFETTIQVNYLSQYYLLMNVQTLLADDAKIVWLSSEFHRNVKWPSNDITWPTKETISIPKDKYTSIKAYNTSKLCGLLAINSLGYKWSNTQRILVAAHPGYFVKTDFCSNWWFYELLYTLMIPFSKSIAQASATPLYCATRPELQKLSVVYFKDCKECLPSSLALDNFMAFRITELTDNLLIETIGFIDQDTVKETEVLKTKEKESLTIKEEAKEAQVIETKTQTDQRKSPSQVKIKEKEPLLSA